MKGEKRTEGTIVAIEGSDGSGKTSTAKRVVDLLHKDGHDAIYLKEPTNESGAGKLITYYLKHNIKIENGELISLFMTDRIYDVQHNIEPALKENKIVVLDRYFLSTACYEGIEGANWENILRRNRVFSPEPNVWFILLPSVSECERRLDTRGGHRSQYDTLKEISRVRDMYQTIVDTDRVGNYVVLKTGGWSLDDVASEIVNKIMGEIT
jgi:thymidylate kinase